MKLQSSVIKTGTNAAFTNELYFYDDETEQKNTLQQSVASHFKSGISVEQLAFERLEPRFDTAVYNYTLNIENELIKINSFYSLQIPFTDLLASMNIFKEEPRIYDF